MQRPKIDQLKLQPCCRRELDEIKRKMELGRVLRTSLAASPFVLVFGSGPVETAFGLGTTDWDLWGQAVKSVRPIVKNRCAQIAGLHALRHSGGDLNRFWRAMYDYFSG